MYQSTRCFWLQDALLRGLDASRVRIRDLARSLNTAEVALEAGGRELQGRIEAAGAEAAAAMASPVPRTPDAPPPEGAVPLPPELRQGAEGEAYTGAEGPAADEAKERARFESWRQTVREHEAELLGRGGQWLEEQRRGVERAYAEAAAEASEAADRAEVALRLQQVSLPFLQSPTAKAVSRHQTI